MGKNTDKLYITHSEWSGKDLHGATGGSLNQDRSGLAKRASVQPFWTCSISQQPISANNAMADSQGYVFDIKNIVPYIRKHSTNPVTGLPMSTKDLIKLHLSTNNEGQFIDPVTHKEFQQLTPAILIRTSGRVYHEDTIKENNLKQKFMRDLLSDEEFTKKDLIVLKGGAGIGKGRPIAQQKQIKSLGKNCEESRPNFSSSSHGITASSDSAGMPKSNLTGYQMASSLTSTAVTPSTKADFLDIPVEKLLRQKKFNDPGYATIHTDLGDLNVELDAKYSPKAVYNFIQLAKKGYYNDLIFHRNIKHFMIQTGDPTGTGRGGQSIFGKPFADEVNTPLRHDARGTLSMANSGKNTNGSQFFITYRRCPHLDGKHTVFGKVVGGLTVLDNLEMVPTDESDRPLNSLRLLWIKVLVDPFEGKLNREEDDNRHQEEKIKQDDDSPWLKRKAVEEIQVGKYLQTNNITSSTQIPDGFKKRVKTDISKSNFSGW